MDTCVLFKVESWECQSNLYDMIIDILWHNGIDREVRAHDGEVFILDTNREESTVISEAIPVAIPLT